ncbi:TNFAIP3-interacting protein 3-like [Thalassophryne amazonica]|uniref:TNFAIP3-interacting protein 3-like n=1 Tax=Thalassophryne amazonica TaxID=390379 RepID=UPI001471D25C|nr:TNFAIP3-interacting protein 3-like [Thalassophryne amazonica]
MVVGQPEQKPERSNRLYPSLTSTQKHKDVMIDTENSHATAAHHHESLQECTQSQTSSASTDSQMKAQIHILEEQRRELLSINEKWAKEYQTMVQYYKDKVQHLKLLLPT